MARKECLLTSSVLKRIWGFSEEERKRLKELYERGIRFWATEYSLLSTGKRIPKWAKGIVSVLPPVPSILFEKESKDNSSTNSNEIKILQEYCEFYGIQNIVVDSRAEYHAPNAVTMDELLYEKVRDSIDRVRFLDLRAHLPDVLMGFQDRFTTIFSNSSFVYGKITKEFEDEFAKYLGVKHVITVNNGTSALLLPLMALGIGSGDEVITVSHTFVATVEAITVLGAKPVFVDIHPKFYTMDVESLKRSITPRAKVIIPVHLYGQVADMDPILEIAKEYGLFVLEDACQAHGAMYKSAKHGGEWIKAGALGDAAAFSFYPGKNLGAYGEGGAVVTNDDELAEKMRAIRDHGSFKKYFHKYIGLNLRMSNLQGAVLLTKLKYLEGWNSKRRENAHLYRELLSGVEEIRLPEEATYSHHVYHLFTILCDKRDELKEFLMTKGIETGIHYPIPVHLQEGYRYLGYKEGDFPITEEVSMKTLSLPMYPELTQEEIEIVVNTIKEFLSRGRKMK